MLGDDVTFVKGIKKSEKYSAYYDRVYVSTLFTYNWKITAKTINYYKGIVEGDPDRIKVGGILATLMPNELSMETGIVPTTGLLNKPDPFRDGNDIIIDRLIPDYDLFNKPMHQAKMFGDDEKRTNYSYTLVDDSYFGYSTKGCPNKCEFCGVRHLEPKYEKYLDLKPYVNAIKEKYGEKTHLVLFDNNILASTRLSSIIKDIKDLGFEKGAYIEYRNKANRNSRKNRFVDFNQGVDARKMVQFESRVKLLEGIAIKPLRIAFDHISETDIYTEAVQMAAKYKIRNLSNYILYNWDDTPEDLWKRLKINIKLNEDMDLKIYSFPMKYIPLDAKDRGSHISPNWNWYFLRGVQRILNVLKGSVMTTEGFFHRAFGKNESKFIDILHMPEGLMMNRKKERWYLEKDWDKLYYYLKDRGMHKDLLDILNTYTTPASIKDAITKTKSGKMKEILEFYLLTYDEVKAMRDKLN